jgi:hypothetical protein
VRQWVGLLLLQVICVPSIGNFILIPFELYPDKCLDTSVFVTLPCTAATCTFLLYMLCKVLYAKLFMGHACLDIVGLLSPSSDNLCLKTQHLAVLDFTGV